MTMTMTVEKFSASLKIVTAASRVSLAAAFPNDKCADPLVGITSTIRQLSAYLPPEQLQQLVTELQANLPKPRTAQVEGWPKRVQRARRGGSLLKLEKES